MRRGAARAVPGREPLVADDPEDGDKPLAPDPEAALPLPVTAPAEEPWTDGVFAEGVWADGV
jgi:hypothetical protein